MTTSRPARVRVRMYQVGFGDCIMVSVEYDEPDAEGRTARHILFDYGSTRLPKGSSPLEGVADLIAEHTGGRLDVLVVTHRHKDHLSGLGIQASRDVIMGLDPRLVLRPWTEDPELATDATSPAELAGLTSAQRFATALRQTQESAGRIHAAARESRGHLAELAAAAAEQMPNTEAVTALNTMSEHGRGQYLHAGKQIDVHAIVPGLQITVLGPPTVDQAPGVGKQASRDPEYWMLRLQRALASAEVHALEATARDASSPAEVDAAVEETTGVHGRRRTAEVPPGPTQWLVDHLQAQRTQSVTRLVRAFDDALNNTSLVMLLEVGELSMLFPGDAQIENWRYTLDRLSADPALAAKLANIDLYKVGHHGSRNATPRTLVKLWEQRSPGTHRMAALMSTLSGTHGKTPATRVPRETLVNALNEVSDLHTSDGLPAGQRFIELVAETSGGPFRPVHG